MHCENRRLLKKNPRLPVWTLLVIVIFTGAIFPQDIISDKNSSIKPPNPPKQSSPDFLRFQTGDALKIRIFPDTSSFSKGIYIIDSDGFVDLPLLGLVRVLDMTPEQIEQFLTTAYVQYLPRPNINVRPLVRVSLLGGFLKPGLYWVDPRESIWGVVAMAGGTLREDGIRKIVWERDTGIVTENIAPYYQSGKSLYAIGFKSGDQLWVTPKPRGQFWDTFRTDILPVVSLIVSAASAAASVYVTYEFYKSPR